MNGGSLGWIFPLFWLVLNPALPAGSCAEGQETSRLFPPRSLMPTTLAGPRDPSTSVSLLHVAPNPNEHGDGIETEVSMGTVLPVLLLAGSSETHPLVVGLEAGVFARFGLQVLERELIASDWLFAVPVYWLGKSGWIRFRYYHASSHMGDEYARRFGNPGVNFSRDAVEIFAFGRIQRRAGLYGGIRYAYNVHPEASKRWVLRGGSQWQAQEDGQSFKSFVAGDLEWDQDAGGVRLELQVGSWLPSVAGRRSIRAGATLLVGTSPLGQFNGEDTVQVGMTLRAIL